MFDKQNDDRSLKLLKAMRVCYNKAKLIHTCKFWISLLLPMCSIVSNFNNKENILKWISLISSVWIFFIYFIKEFEMFYVVKGAKLQEAFDSYVFEIPWNDIFIGRKIGEDEIFELSQKSREKEENLKKWYKGLKSNKKIINILIAQRSNLIWGISLKKIYLIIIRFVLIFYISISVFLACKLNIDVKTYLVIILIPSTPLVIHWIEIINNLKSQNNKVSNKIYHIEKMCNNIIDSKNYNNFNVCRQIQDFIYFENRVNSILIPNFLYKFRLKKYEEKMFAVNKILTEKSNG